MVNLSTYSDMTRLGLLAALVCLSLAALTGAATAQTHRANDPPWRGQWIWSPRSDAAPTLDVDPHRWLMARPGGWDRTLVHRILGNAAAAGLGAVDWHLQDADGMRLYPSERRDAVRRYPNWGVDFGETDLPAIAIETARRLDLDLRLVARNQAVGREAASRYGEAAVVMAGEVSGDRVEAVGFDWKSRARRHLADGTHYFRRVFEVTGDASSAELTLTAQDGYRLYVNGNLIGRDADYWRGETYPIAELLEPGRNVIAVEVEPELPEAGLLANLRYRDDAGEHFIATDRAWRVTTRGGEGWTKAGYDDAGWRTPGVVGFEGVGYRFRLKEPWRNRRSIAASRSLAPRYVTRLSATADVHGGDAPHTVDGTLSDSPYWQATDLPATLTLELDEPTRLREVRIHSGYLGFAGNPSGVSSVKSYRLQAWEGGRWVDLVEPVSDAPTYDGQSRDDFAFIHAFSPRRVSKLRLVVLETTDTGRRMRCPDTPCVEPADRVCFIREVEVVKAFDQP